MREIVVLICLIFALIGVDVQNVQSMQRELHPPIPLNKDIVNDSIGYPELARQLNIAGQIIYRVRVSKAGEYVGCELITSPIPILSKRVEQYLPLLKFSPAIADNIPVDSWINIPFNFELFGGGGGPDREYRKGLSEQLKNRNYSAIIHFTNSIDRGYHLFQLHSVIQRAICSYRIGNYDTAELDFQWALAQKKKFVRKWRKERVDLIQNPYVLALEVQELHKLVESDPIELGNLIQAVFSAFTP